MIDIHTHILPGIDDGARDMNESLQMARLAAQDGTTHIFATPHHRFYQTYLRQEISDRVNALQREINKAKIALTILPGNEVRVEADVFTDWDDGVAGPLGKSRYVLAEANFDRYDLATEALFFEFFERGYIPVMAHPERNAPIQNDLSLLEPYLQRGGLTQITGHSLTGYHGQRAKQVAEEMLRAGMVHIIASDAHHASRRQPVLAEARAIAAKIVGEAQATAMVMSTPLAIVNDQLITAEIA